jgi:hypothetical protein
VRFTLAAEDFEPWLTAVRRYAWTPDLIERLQRAQSSAAWYCRPDPLPLARVIAIHTRSYTGHRWEAFDLSKSIVLEAEPTESMPGAECLGIKLGGKLYWSIRETRVDEPDHYGFANPTPAMSAEAA